MNLDHTLIDSLRHLGLSALEGDIYLHLLSSGQAQTAYSVGKKLGKATANVYSAMNSLEAKGAVAIEDGERRLCLAVKPSVFLRQLERAFVERTRRVQSALEEQRVAPGTEHVVQLHSAGATLEFAHHLLEEAETIFVLDCFPHALRHLEPSILRAAERGVTGFVQAYGETTLPAHDNLKLAKPTQPQEIVDFWQAQQINLVTDGRRALVALLDSALESVHQAVRTDVLYLACMLHAGFLREHNHHSLAGTLADPDADVESARRALAESPYFHHLSVPGQVELAERYGTTS